MAPRLQLRDINLTLGLAPLLQGAELSVSPGERIALVGRNGSGKSTLLKIVAGEIAADKGERFVQPGLAMAYLEQSPDFSGFASALVDIELLAKIPGRAVGTDIVAQRGAAKADCLAQYGAYRRDERGAFPAVQRRSGTSRPHTGLKQ